MTRLKNGCLRSAGKDEREHDKRGKKMAEAIKNKAAESAVTETKKKWLNSLEIRIGIGIVLMLIVCRVFPQIQCLAGCTAVVMCTQEGKNATIQSGLLRLLGVICGGIAGIIVVLVDGWIGQDILFFFLCGAGILLNFLLCRTVHMPGITSRVSAITFCLVVLLADGNARIFYAWNRFAGTLAGAVVALAVAAVWRTAAFLIRKVSKKEERNNNDSADNDGTR